MTTELKTLKDLRVFPRSMGKSGQENSVVITAELRKEAVEWVKNYLAGIEYHDKMALEKAISFEDSRILNSLLETRIDWIKHFFNLTEEDLK